MYIKKVEEIYFVSGNINEECDLNKYNLPSGRVKFDLSGLKTLNSIGIREWINGLIKLNISPTYTNCSHSFVLLLNMVKELFGNNVIIESFQVPAYCNKCAEDKILLVKSGIDFFPGKVFSYQLPKCKIDGSILEPLGDFDSDYYFVAQLSNK